MTAAAASRTEPLLAFDEARALLARAAGPLPAVTLPVEETPGLFLAEAPASDGPLPCFTVSTMDGYAVRAADLEARRPLLCRRLLLRGRLLCRHVPFPPSGLHRL